MKRKHPKTESHNYIPMVVAAGQILYNQEVPEVYHAVVKHDDWCDHLHEKGFCNCNPTVEILKAKNTMDQTCKSGVSETAPEVPKVQGKNGTT